MGPRKSGHPDVVRPAWLPERPSGEFQRYAPGLPDHIIYDRWYRIAGETGIHVSLYDAHRYALEGVPAYLHIMQKFMLALATERLKR